MSNNDHWDKPIITNKTMKNPTGVPTMKTTICPPAKEKPVVKDGYLMRRWKGQFRLRVTRKGKITYNSSEWYKNEKDLVTALEKDLKVLTKYIEVSLFCLGRNHNI
mgnify:CR=1 FL=1